VKTAIVTTTINIPVLLRKYAENAQHYGHRELVFVVIGDRKSPPETTAFCNSLNQYFPCEYLDIERQQQYLADFPELWSHLRFDSIQRRNIGMLFAYQHGAEVIITIDDDNFVMSQDFVGLHRAAGQRSSLPLYASTSGFFDVCSFLDTDDDLRFYHRGFPQQQRWAEASSFVSSCRAAGRVAINAGFWLDNPDIDAVTRMERQPIVRGFRPGWNGNFGLCPGTWSPFNSQNTALMRDVIPAYFLSPYIGRYDDIWASYVVCRIAEHLGDLISFGEPLVRQERNPHDLWKDLDAERYGMILTDGFCQALRAISLTGKTYHECFGEIAAHLPENWRPSIEDKPLLQDGRNSFLEGLRIWHEVFKKLGATPDQLASAATAV